MISALKNRPVPALFGLASVATIGVALAAIAFPHFGAHLPQMVKNPLLPYFGLALVVGVGHSLLSRRRHFVFGSKLGKNFKCTNQLVLAVTILITAVALGAIASQHGALAPHLQKTGHFLSDHWVKVAVIGGVVGLAAIGIELVWKKLRRRRLL